MPARSATSSVSELAQVAQMSRDVQHDLEVTTSNLHSANVNTVPLSTNSLAELPGTSRRTNNIVRHNENWTVQSGSERRSSRGSVGSISSTPHQTNVRKHERLTPNRTASLPGTIITEGLARKDADLYKEEVSGSCGGRGAVETTLRDSYSINVYSSVNSEQVECDVDGLNEESPTTCTTRTKVLSVVLVLFAILALSTTSALMYLKLHPSALQQKPQQKHNHVTQRLRNQTLYCGVFPLKYAPDQSVNIGLKTQNSQQPTNNSKIYLPGQMHPQEATGPVQRQGGGFARSWPIKIKPSANVIRRKKPRVVGGSDGIIRWQVSLWLSGQIRCGGSIVLNNWILTAAHCSLLNLDVNVWTVYAGAADRSKRKVAPAQNRSVVAIVQHENYRNDGTFDYDISLMKLDRAFIFNDEIKPVCIPPQGYTFTEGMHCFVSGWGQMDSDGYLPKPKVLQYAQVDIIDHKTCNSSAWMGGQVTSRMLCAGKKQGIKDACEGDSGGPLSCYWRERGVWTLAGSVSWGFSCGKAKQPGVYTRISFFTDWIWNNIEKVEGNNLT